MLVCRLYSIDVQTAEPSRTKFLGQLTFTCSRSKLKSCFCKIHQFKQKKTAKKNLLSKPVLFPGIADINWMTGYGNLLGSYSRWTKLIHGHEGILINDLMSFNMSFVRVLCLCMMSFLLCLDKTNSRTAMKIFF